MGGYEVVKKEIDEPLAKLKNEGYEVEKKEIDEALAKLKNDGIIVSKVGAISNKYGINDDKLETFSNEIKDCYDNIDRAVKEIHSVILVRKTINKNISSYGLKHVLEDERRRIPNYEKIYISNGEFIVAMVICGFNFQSILSSGAKISPNLYFNCSLMKRKY